MDRYAFSSTRICISTTVRTTPSSRSRVPIFTPPATRAALMQQTRPTPVPREGLPVVTSASPLSFHFNGEEVAYIPLKVTEVPGEVGVYFRDSDVFVFGDVYAQTYPYIFPQNGATIENIVDNYNLHSR